MGFHAHHETLPNIVFSPDISTDSFPPPAASVTPTDLSWPFSKFDSIDSDDLRVTAYEIFFTSCRSSPGFGSRSLNYYSASDSDTGSGTNTPGSKNPGLFVAVNSKVKRQLGLKTMRRSNSITPCRRSNSIGSAPPSPGGGSPSPGLEGSINNIALTMPLKSRRPLTTADIMRQQMRVTEQGDNRLRKTLMRTLVGQMGRNPETIILPLELLRHLKPSEFNSAHEYHLWQKRQLKILEAGLLLHPVIPLDRSNSSAARLSEIIRSVDTTPLDTSKNSESLKALCSSVFALAWRSEDGRCHWADGYPFNIHLYVSLLRSVFDLKDETSVLDEVDDLIELVKKTWSTLGIYRSIHNLCFTWVLFEQYVCTGQAEPDLLAASLAMLADVANDAKKVDCEPLYVKILGAALGSMKRWTEKRLLNYHDNFHSGTLVFMENILPFVFSTTKILEEDVPGASASTSVSTSASTSKSKSTRDRGMSESDFTGNRVDQYIRSSLTNAFTKLLEKGNIKGSTIEVNQVSQTLHKLANETEELAVKERKNFSPVIKRWHPVATGVAAVTLHTCYGTLLRQYLAGVSALTSETISILQRAEKLEQVLVQMVVEDSVDCEDGGKTVIREMVLFEVDSVIARFLRQWIQERLKKAKEVLIRAKETETWNPKSKSEPYAESAVEIMRNAKEIAEDFFEIPIPISIDLVHELAKGLEHLFKDYTTFVQSCGSKQSYIPTLPPLTRCNRDSRFIKLWKKATPCSVPPGMHENIYNETTEGNHPRPSTSRGTQRLYIRLNTLHYLQSHLHSLEKTLALSPRVAPSPRPRQASTGPSSYFEQARNSIHNACQLVSEVAAFRLIFLDSNSVFYGSLYVGDVENSRVKPALRILKQNITLLAAILTERAQSLALKEVMKASFEAYLMVLLAGGSSRIFCRSDHKMIEEDFEQLKEVFYTCCDGVIGEEVVEKEADTVEGVVALMGNATEQLVEDFSIVACESSGIGMAAGTGQNQKLPMPPTTGRWNRSDPNTVLRVLCHRNEGAANHFLKRTFQLAKRR